MSNSRRLQGVDDDGTPISSLYIAEYATLEERSTISIALCLLREKKNILVHRQRKRRDEGARGPGALNSGPRAIEGLRAAKNRADPWLGRTGGEERTHEERGDQPASPPVCLTARRSELCRMLLPAGTPKPKTQSALAWVAKTRRPLAGSGRAGSLRALDSQGKKGFWLSALPPLWRCCWRDCRCVALLASNVQKAKQLVC